MVTVGRDAIVVYRLLVVVVKKLLIELHAGVDFLAYAGVKTLNPEFCSRGLRMVWVWRPRIDDHVWR